MKNKAVDDYDACPGEQGHRDGSDDCSSPRLRDGYDGAVAKERVLLRPSLCVGETNLAAETATDCLGSQKMSILVRPIG
jgi:hypothetical protein